MWWMAAAMAASTIAGFWGNKTAADRAKSLLRLKEAAASVRAEQDKLHNIEQTQNLLSAQTAQMAMKGVALSSPTFAAFTMDDWAQLHRANKAAELNKTLSILGYEAQEKAISNQPYWSLLQSLGNSGSWAALMSKSGKK